MCWAADRPKAVTRGSWSPLDRARGHTGAMIEAVIFDFDGVIVDTEWHSFEVWRALFAEHGADLSLDDFAICIGTRNAIDMGALLTAKTGRAGPSDADLRALKHRRHLGDVAGLPLLPGVQQWLAEIARRDMGCAIASSSERA